MADKTFTQMTEAEFEQLLHSIRGGDDQKKYFYAYFSIDCLSDEAINLARFKTLLDAVNENENIHFLEFTIVDSINDPGGIPAEGIELVAKFLKTNTTLHRLSLEFHSRFTIKAVEALAEAIKVNKSLQEIDLGCCYIGNQGVTILAEAFSINTSIKKINLSANLFGSGFEGDSAFGAIAECLKQNDTIEDIDLSHNYSRDEKEIIALAEALIKNQRIVSINLRSINLFGHMSHIINALKFNKCIKTMVLNANNLGNESAKSIMEVLKLNQNLTELYLDGADFSDEGIFFIAQGLKLNNTLKKLHIWKNAHSSFAKITNRGIQALNEVLQDQNLSLVEFICEDQQAVVEVNAQLSPINRLYEFLNRNSSFANLNDSIVDFRSKLHSYSIPLKTTISQCDIEKYFDLINYDYAKRAAAFKRYSFPLKFNQLSEEDQKAIQDSREMWGETKVNAENKDKTALGLYQTNIEKIKNLREVYESTAENPAFKEKIKNELNKAAEALDLAYYGRDAESLQLDPVVRGSKLEAVLKTTQNKAHQEDAKKSLVLLYYILMGRTKDFGQEKIYALSILACGVEEDGIFSKANIAAQYKIENIEAEIKQRKTELKLDKALEEENQPEKTTEQKVYSNAGKSSFTKFHPQSEGTSTNATPGASTSPTPAPAMSLDDEKNNKI